MLRAAYRNFDTPHIRNDYETEPNPCETQYSSICVDHLQIPDFSSRRVITLLFVASLVTDQYRRMNKRT